MRGPALQILDEWLSSGRFPDRLIPARHPRRAALVEVVYGVVRRRATLDWFIAQCSDRPPAPAARPALLAGAYQLVFMDSVPDHAAVSATVGALAGPARRLSGYVNAVLRRLARERDTLRERLAAEPLWTRESYPAWLVGRWEQRYGPAAAAALCAAGNVRPRVALRPRGGTAVPDFVAHLRAAGVEAAPHPADPDRFVVLAPGHRVRALPGYSAGAFAVQDPATAVAVDLLDVQPRHRVLDVCAAPGGKTVMAADRLADPALLTAVDCRADRLAVLRENLARCRCHGVEVVCADAAGPGLSAAVGPGHMDRVLCDVPCTNTGVLARRPDARWRVTPERLAAMTRQQAAILTHAAPLVRPGGRLVYSTCSLEPEENEALVAAWLKEHPGFTQAAEVRRLPSRDACDGAYAAALERRF